MTISSKIEVYSQNYIHTWYFSSYQQDIKPKQKIIIKKKKGKNIKHYINSWNALCQSICRKAMLKGNLRGHLMHLSARTSMLPIERLFSETFEIYSQVSMLPFKWHKKQVFEGKAIKEAQRLVKGWWEHCLAKPYRMKTSRIDSQ